MSLNRRRFLGATMMLPAAIHSGVAHAQSKESNEQKSTQRIRRIATEEAFTIPEIAAEWKKVLDDNTSDETGFQALAGAVYANPNETNMLIRKRLGDLGENRIRDMDELGIDVQVLALGAPGIQILKPELAKELSALANDRLIEAINTYPDRYAGLAAVAPQFPEEAAIELERSVQKGLSGALINSHTKGEYLDDKKFWPIFEAAEALDVPIYLHPRTPSPQMIEPYLDYGLYSAAWGFGADTGLHVLRLMFSGVFDEFPNLKIILGHMGEAIPFWLGRIDTQFKFLVEGGSVQKLKSIPSEYFRNNFYITTSGMNIKPPLSLSLDVIGADRIMFSFDYPFDGSHKDIEFMDTVAISHADRRKIYHENAEKLFKINGQA